MACIGNIDWWWEIWCELIILGMTRVGTEVLTGKDGRKGDGCERGLGDWVVKGGREAQRACTWMYNALALAELKQSGLC